MKEQTLKFKCRFRFKPAQTIILGFLGIILIGSFLLTLPISSKSREWTNFIDALFTSTSAVCVTGLTTLSTALHFSYFGQAVILLLIQIGGLGFMTATTFVMLIIRKKISFKDRLTIQDSLSQDTTKGIVRLVRAILILTGIAEGAGSAILMPFFCAANGPIGIWQAVFTSVSAFCNAGFDLFAVPGNEFVSLYGYKSNAIVCLTVCALIIIGGLGFAVITDLFVNKGKMKKLSVHTKVVITFTGFLILFGTVMFMILEYNNPGTLKDESFMQKLLSSFFQSVTARTAGFTAMDQAAMHPASKVIFSTLMFIGASPGATGGGIKTTTFALIIITVVSVMRGRNEVVMFKHKIGYKTVYKAFSIAMLGIALILSLTVFLLIAERGNAALAQAGLYSFNNMLYESASAFSTTGLSAGVTPFLSAPSKIAGAVVMFIGRVGLMNFGVAFFTDKDSTLIKYPEGSIIVG